MKKLLLLSLLGFVIGHLGTDFFLEKTGRECLVTVLRINPTPLDSEFIGPPVPERRTYVDESACQAGEQQ